MNLVESVLRVLSFLFSLFASSVVLGDLESSWALLGGPEIENGKPIVVVSSESARLELDTWKRRGHVARSFEPVELPAVISFDWETEYDPSVTEVATELWGTGDFRISVVGMPIDEDIGGLDEANLGQWEGVQFRVFPHLDDSPIRRRTPPDNESHTATSIWVRYTNPGRWTGDNGAPHTGLQSDACQNRNKVDGTHNCGWDRHTIVEGGFGLANKQRAKVVIFVSEDEAYLEVNDRRFSIEPEGIRFAYLSAIVVGITNTSRGFRSLQLSDLRASTVEEFKEDTLASSYRTTPEGAIEAYQTKGYSLSEAVLQYSGNLEDWEDLTTLELIHAGELEFTIPKEKRAEGFFRVLHRPRT
ncbi:hypothetical protein QEH56_14695 [Pelagicoccus enzymogenes]|uniref:hypothetical protein n=1 Tax=Pelagicoccus enzymogenes TaxID=2773457 RepID=UPI00280E5B69|nr:hypothetical protein [Pelagicoccus enzymogenes]MDQ8199412.1 hypothetical protein [Pelagicoccus enzymogenes]